MWLPQDPTEVLNHTWGPGEPSPGGNNDELVWYDTRGHAAAHLSRSFREYALSIVDFMPLAELLSKGRPTWFTFETIPTIGTRYDRYKARLVETDERSGVMTLAGTEWSQLGEGTRVQVSSHAGVVDYVIVSLKAYGYSHVQRKDHELLREIDAVWGPHAIATIDSKPVPVWRDPDAGRRAVFYGSHISVSSYQPLAKTLELAASFVGARRADVVAHHEVKVMSSSSPRANSSTGSVRSSRSRETR